jgi:hypothetical protein
MKDDEGKRTNVSVLFERREGRMRELGDAPVDAISRY